MFDTREKVVCINDTFEPLHRKLYRELPKKGEIYTVRECSIGRTKTGAADPGISFRLLLEEMTNDLDPYMDEASAEELGFRTDRFAPLTSLEEEEELEETMTTAIGKSY
ncbi:MAG: hypothetical protein NT164_08180 [Verrucomicrobiae bacterium]|nr:hypothetical protein [Verrucomicrobiae bacterium]